MLMTCGNNADGQLGDNTQTSRSSPVQTITYGANWKSVAVGYAHTAAIKTDGTLWNWGKNNYGQSGDNTVALKSSPVQTTAFGTNWKNVASGNLHCAAIKTDGTLWCWGRGDNGALGDNDGNAKSSPVQTITYATNWKSVACGIDYTAAIKTDGTLWAWGDNYAGQLGDNTSNDKSSPVQTVARGTNWKQVSCKSRHTSAIKTDGTLWLWGSNNFGQLGDNTNTYRSSPVQTFTGGINWKQVSCGLYHTAATKIDGTLWGWGSGDMGQLGNNITVFNLAGERRSSPVQTVAFGTNWKQVSCGDYHTAAIKTDGTLWVWGSNNQGQLCDNTTTNKSSPVQTILYGQNWKIVACGYSMTTAIKDGDF
jgi:hypothetical protein